MRAVMGHLWMGNGGDRWMSRFPSYLCLSVLFFLLFFGFFPFIIFTFNPFSVNAHPLSSDLLI